MHMSAATRNPLNSRPRSADPAAAGRYPGRADVRTRDDGRQFWIAFATIALCAFLLSLAGRPGHAQAGPFAALSGSWSGGGSVTLSDGSRERLQCRASYSVHGGGNDLDLTLRCASDSYNFNFRGNARHRGGTIVGNWSEATMNAGGRFVGRAGRDSVHARVQGENFSASLDISTRGNRQSVSIRSPGSRFSNVSVSLRRR